ncbi:MAG: DNA-directed RNA polymerase subunit omega [Varibaculum sp.]|nr:DNA-directed RNA polymerase subunit omega [Varibaculum sp.]
MSGTIARAEGITFPPIDDLLEKVPSKYALVVYAAKRAKQINTYTQQIADGMFSTPGPLVPTSPEDKPLTIALEEINQGLLEYSEEDETVEENTQLSDSDLDRELAEADALDDLFKADAE